MKAGLRKRQKKNMQQANTVYKSMVYKHTKINKHFHTKRAKIHMIMCTHAQTHAGSRAHTIPIRNTGALMRAHACTHTYTHTHGQEGHWGRRKKSCEKQRIQVFF